MKTISKTLAASAILLSSVFASTASFAADKYEFDASHSQVVFSYNHFGFSTTYGMFSGFNGTAMLDADDITKSSVQLEIKTADIITGWDARTGHFSSPDFFNVAEFPVATFVSTSVEKTGDKTAKITGDLTILDHTKSIVLDATLNKMAKHPVNGKEWAGFSATTTLTRSEFGLGKFAPNVSDEVNIIIEVEMGKVDG